MVPILVDSDATCPNLSGYMSGITRRKLIGREKQLYRSSCVIVAALCLRKRAIIIDAHAAYDCFLYNMIDKNRHQWWCPCPSIQCNVAVLCCWHMFFQTSLIDGVVTWGSIPIAMLSVHCTELSCFWLLNTPLSTLHVLYRLNSCITGRTVTNHSSHFSMPRNL